MGGKKNVKIDKLSSNPTRCNVSIQSHPCSVERVHPFVYDSLSLLNMLWYLHCTHHGGAGFSLLLEKQHLYVYNMLT